MPSDTPGPVDDRVPGGPHPSPRWVKLLAVGAVIVVLAVVLAMLLVGGDHGPGRHGG